MSAGRYIFMINKLKKYFIPRYWYIYWAFISGIFIPLSMVVVIINATTDSHVGFVFLASEFIAPMLFGVYLADKEKFKTNLYKFLFIFLVLISSVLFLGQLAMVVTPLCIIFLLWLMKISKRESKLAFGSVAIYTFSATPGLFALIYFHLDIFGLILLYISKGAIFGKVMQIIYEKRLKA